ncbi:MAG: hypothetical protein ACI9FN_003140 [Saprospiraceae bacterium]|jgi:hypothetical protein
MNRTWIGILIFLVFISTNSLTGQCFSSEGRSKLMPLGVHLIGLLKKQDSIKMAILSTSYLCLEKGDQSNIEFADGSFIYISNLLELNCDGKAYFSLTDNNLQQLSTKEISKVVLGSRYEGYTTTATPEDGQASAFLNLMTCAVSSSGIGNTIEAKEMSELETNTIQLPVEQSNPATPQQVNSASAPVSVIVQEPVIPPLRTVQFIATTGGKTFSELSYLGTLISEKAGDKELYRYKIQGNFTDTDVQHVIASLAIHGYQGAFENK